MEYLLPALVTLVTVFVRWATRQLGKEIGGAVVLVVAFILSGAAALIFTQTDENFRNQLIQLFGLQMVYYEVVYKRLILPSMGKML